MAKRGVLVKGGTFLEGLGKIKAIALDKTGTITEGKPRVLKVVSFGSTDAALLTAAASIEKLSSHPLAKAVVEYAEKNKVEIKSASDFKTVPGKGPKQCWTEGNISSEITAWP